MSADTMESASPPEQERLPIQDHFLGWQCRVREYSMRQSEGRPSTGMRPRVVLEDGTEAAAAVTLLLLPNEPQESIQQFRFMVQKTHDPQERYKKAVQLLSSSFYQHMEDFSGVMTAWICETETSFADWARGQSVDWSFSEKRLSTGRQLSSCPSARTSTYTAATETQ